MKTKVKFLKKVLLTPEFTLETSNVKAYKYYTQKSEEVFDNFFLNFPFLLPSCHLINFLHDHKQLMFHNNPLIPRRRLDSFTLTPSARFSWVFLFHISITSDKLKQGFIRGCFGAIKCFRPRKRGLKTFSILFFCMWVSYFV